MASAQKRHWLLASLLALVLLAGCAASVSGPQRARLVGQELSLQYMELHQRYNQLMASLPQERQAWLREHAAPVLNRLKQGVIAWNRAAMDWSEQGQPGQDMDALLDHIELLAFTAAELLQEVADART